MLVCSLFSVLCCLLLSVVFFRLVRLKCICVNGVCILCVIVCVSICWFFSSCCSCLVMWLKVLVSGCISVVLVCGVCVFSWLLCMCCVVWVSCEMLCYSWYIIMYIGSVIVIIRISSRIVMLDILLFC